MQNNYLRIYNVLYYDESIVIRMYACVACSDPRTYIVSTSHDVIVYNIKRKYTQCTHLHPKRERLGVDLVNFVEIAEYYIICSQRQIVAPAHNSNNNNI